MNLLGIALLLFGLLSCDVCRAAPADEVNLLAVEVGPQNVAIVLTSTTTVTLSCCTTDASSSGARVQWWEYGTKTSGNQISDGSTISSFHPNAARYSLQSDSRCYNLTISPVNSQDATRYVCKDFNEDPPATVQLGAQLIVIDSDPICVSQLGSSDVAFEGAYYTMECSLTFNASSPIAPQMTWSSPSNAFDTRSSISGQSVRSSVSFNADRSFDLEALTMSAGFTSVGFGGPDMATNVPTWTYSWTSPQIHVNWPPANMIISPNDPSYEIGTLLTCNTDSNPPARYSWLALDGPVAGSTWSTQSITLTISMVGQSTFRCRAENTINCANFSRDDYYNITVNPYNACQSNPCQSGGTCIRDVNDYRCNCIPGITGFNCETVIKFCASMPCLNGGSCLDRLNGYDCICPDPFTGVFCEIP